MWPQHSKIILELISSSIPDVRLSGLELQVPPAPQLNMRVGDRTAARERRVKFSFVVTRSGII
jgi:hypothetical protein